MRPPGCGTGRSRSMPGDRGLDVVDEERGLETVLEALAARNLHRLPDRHHAGRRRRRGHLLPTPRRRNWPRARPKKQFGRGAIEGVAGPESANNAAAAGVLVPLLTLGIPTTATAAMMLVAFQRYNIQPGPLLFEVEGALVWALIASLYVGNLMLLVLNLPLVGIWVKILQIPRPYLYAGILVFAALGAFSVNFTPVDVFVLLVIGVLGFFMRRYGYPIAPLVVGMILGPIFESQLRRSLAISQGDPMALVSTPIAAGIYISLVVIFVLSFWMKKRQRVMESATLDDDSPRGKEVSA